MTDVTVVVIAYNQASFLRAAIQSAQNQTIPVRVVVVDDGSKDDSVAIARSLGCDVEQRPHQGALATFRAAADLVQTPFFVRLDGDDFLAPTFVADTLSVMSDDPGLGFVYTGMQLFGATDHYEPALPFSPSRLRWYNYAHAASLTRTAAYRQVGGYDPEFSRGFEDWALWCAMVDVGWRGAGIDQPLLFYRQYPQGDKHAAGPQSAYADSHVNPRAAEEARWRIARKHLRYYGPVGWARLLISRILLRLGLRVS
jgi:glycogen synthase